MLYICYIFYVIYFILILFIIIFYCVFGYGFEGGCWGVLFKFNLLAHLSKKFVKMLKWYHVMLYSEKKPYYKVRKISTYVFPENGGAG